jgi:hypothetical protein
MQWSSQKDLALAACYIIVLDSFVACMPGTHALWDGPSSLGEPLPSMLYWHQHAAGTSHMQMHAWPSSQLAAHELKRTCVRPQTLGGCACMCDTLGRSVCRPSLPRHSAKMAATVYWNRTVHMLKCKPLYFPVTNSRSFWFYRFISKKSQIDLQFGTEWVIINQSMVTSV